MNAHNVYEAEYAKMEADAAAEAQAQIDAPVQQIDAPVQ